MIAGETVVCNMDDAVGLPIVPHSNKMRNWSTSMVHGTESLASKKTPAYFLSLEVCHDDINAQFSELHCHAAADPLQRNDRTRGSG